VPPRGGLHLKYGDVAPTTMGALVGVSPG
jgi:hypothetical protein